MVKPYVSADLSQQPALISERSVISSEPRNITPWLFYLYFEHPALSQLLAWTQIFDSCK